MKAILIALLLTASVVVNAKVYLSTCARMDTPILSKAAHGMCITSCKFQGCRTGSCKRNSGRATCMCVNCSNEGGSWMSIDLGTLIDIGKVITDKVKNWKPKLPKIPRKPKLPKIPRPRG